MKIEEIPTTAAEIGLEGILKSLKNIPQSPEKYQHDLRALEDSSYWNLDVVRAIALHANPNLAWCSEANASIVEAIVQTKDIDQYLYPFIQDDFCPRLKNIEKVAHWGRGKQSALKPRPSFQDQKFDASTLAQAWFLIDVTNNQDKEICKLTLLLIIDTLQFDIPAKIQACKLLEHLQIQDTPSIRNLIEPLQQNLAKCLNHIPSITPETDSFSLLSVAYPCIYRLDSEFGTDLNFIETIATILSSISHVVSYPKLASFLLDQLSVCISHIGITVLVSITKIFYTLNQIITNVGILEQSPSIIQHALEVENAIIQLESPLVYTFIYDLMGAYYILRKRVETYNIKGLSEDIQRNMSSLKQLSIFCDKLSEFEDIQDSINKIN
ncbi:hypothetical protein CANMA_003815 [Candida margitis]|uniref:uncharacterized protein n=1 Tax=Candida margitis TaxID=1775924 RepID=UPI002226E88E|nr:uncharacterized protein CANMA_003815 [Candida margitis]KAI5961295.1 hypothetical protein CANMA_003815 [Candida margitis]